MPIEALLTIDTSEDRRVILEYVSHMLDTLGDVRGLMYRPADDHTFLFIVRGPRTDIEQQIHALLTKEVTA